jgi:GNAT superfamily N-acetyltransferase
MSTPVVHSAENVDSSQNNPDIQKEPYVIVPLDSKKHNRAAFSCGEDALDNYLKRYASQSSDKDIARTFVIHHSGSDVILGYYTLSAASVISEDLPEEIVKQLGRYRTFPVTLMGRLAVDESQQGKGIGKILMVDALRRAARASRDVASIAMVIDAKNERAVKFYKHLGFETFRNDPRRLYISLRNFS